MPRTIVSIKLSCTASHCFSSSRVKVRSESLSAINSNRPRGDILWDQNRMIVRSPKTEHHVGHEMRVVPLFPELVPVLNQAWDEAEEGAEHVVTKQRDATANFRTTMTKIIAHAGLKPWPKLFHALRASIATELADKYPGHVAAAWLGHTQQVANKHYRQVTDDHYEEAARSPERAAQSADVKLQALAGKLAGSGNA
nr:site-specific integrase [Aeoliella straminimaris]